MTRRPDNAPQLRRQAMPAVTCALLLVIGCLGTVVDARTGPRSQFYLTAGNQGLNWIVKGSRTASFPQAHWFTESGFVFGEHAIAVAKTVRTLGTNFVGMGLPASQGAEYRRNGAYTGTDFVYPPDAASLSFLDATTDGSHIYAVSSNTAAVYRLDMNWSNPIKLFDVMSNDIGITYDPSDGGSVWVSSLSENEQIVHYSLTGQVLSSFDIPTGASALALDHADSTLWFSYGFDGTLYQYSLGGQFLGSFTYGALAGTNHLGGEFAWRGRPVKN